MARINLLESHRQQWRRHGISSFSLPDPATWQARDPANLASFATPLGQKRFFLTFSGRLRKNPIRLQLRSMFSTKVVAGRPSLIRESTMLTDEINQVSPRHAGSRDGDNHERRYSYKSTLHDAIFPLILSGDHATTTRFAEVVCSGGVPVYVRSPAPHMDWRMPFEDVVPFETYGLIISNLTRIAEALTAIPSTRLEHLRARAHSMCRAFFSTIEAQLHGMLTFLLNPEQATTSVESLRDSNAQ